MRRQPSKPPMTSVKEVWSVKDLAHFCSAEIEQYNISRRLTL